MAVELALERARLAKVDTGIKLDVGVELNEDLIQKLVHDCSPDFSYHDEKIWTDGIDGMLLDEIYSDLSDIFAARVTNRQAQAAPTFYAPQLIRDCSNCPVGVTEDVIGLLDVGLLYHNDGHTKLAVATYQEAMHSWRKNLPETHTEEQVIMFCLCAIGEVLESDASKGYGEYDMVALVIYLLAVLTGERKGARTMELALACSCVGSVCFHLGTFERALEYFKKASLIRTELALADEEAGSSVTAQELAIAYNNTGVCLASLDRNVEALEEYQKAYHILREHGGAADIFTACVARNLERVQRNIGDHPPWTELRPTKGQIRPKKEKKAKGGKKKKKK